MNYWSTPDLKKLNKERIRKEVQKNEMSTKALISRETGLSLVTCNSLLNEMLADQEILEVSQKELVMGRPAAQFSYNKDYLHVLGLWVSDERGCNVIDCVTADAFGTMLQQKRKGPEEITYEEIEGMIAECFEADSLIRRISIGIPGVTQHGVVESCDVRTLVGVPLEQKLEERFHVEVEVRNDMDYLTYGIYHTAYQGESNLAVAYFPQDNEGTVGCGCVINGRVMRGHSRYSGTMSCIFEGFGMPREEQVKAINSEKDRISYIQKLVVIIGAMIDPEEIHLLGIDLDQTQQAEIEAFVESIMTAQHMPKILLDKDAEVQYRLGLIRAGLNHMLFPLLQPL